MLNLIDISDPSSQESPITTEFIRSTVESLSEIDSIDKLINELLKKVSAKSSRHKFIIQGTKITAEDTNINLNISTEFGAVWETSRDGYLKLKFQDIKDTEVKDEKRETDDYIEVEKDNSNHILLSIFWVFVG